jgi:hypothetical protein
MIRLQYKGRINKAKFSSRGLVYILSDQAARLLPALQRLCQFPVESQPMEEAAQEVYPIPSLVVDTPPPECFSRLHITPACPLQATHSAYFVDGVAVTGWCGAMIKNGLLLTVCPDHNWAGSIRLRPYFMRTLPASRPYYNLMASIPGRDHVFHWLFDAILPFIAFVESGKAGNDIGLIVNAKQSEIQKLTIGFLKERYGIHAIEPVSEAQGVFVPHCRTSGHGLPRGLQSPLALALLDDLARFIAGDSGLKKSAKRIFVSRDDARLRRVLNERDLLLELNARGYERVTLRGMPLAQQVALFLNAEAIAGPHGAGLTHISWCRPGTKVTEFFPDPDAGRKVRNASSDFWLISCQRKLNHSCHFGGPVRNIADGFTIPRETLIGALEA